MFQMRIQLTKSIFKIMWFKNLDSNNIKLKYWFKYLKRVSINLRYAVFYLWKIKSKAYLCRWAFKITIDN